MSEPSLDPPEDTTVDCPACIDADGDVSRCPRCKGTGQIAKKTLREFRVEQEIEAQEWGR